MQLIEELQRIETEKKYRKSGKKKKAKQRNSFIAASPVAHNRVSLLHS